ncbi:MAG TPA: DUF4625 domain-containing protein [Ohtaekwangia sp.]|nr:DUF4625 domain-containing protein [Ohtaekwangia sp.]
MVTKKNRIDQHKLKLLFWMVTWLLLARCSSDDEKIDTKYPVIDLTFVEGFPSQCSVIEKGKLFSFKARFSDNAQLGSFSVDIHHNFDHHTHSTEVNDCDIDPVKVPVNPFLLIKNFSIPDGQREYEAHLEIEVPENVDAGDYHFLIRLTDKEGWQSLRGLSIKIK